LTVLQAIIFKEGVGPGSSSHGLSHIEALRAALRHERTARKKIEKNYQAKICELQDENERLKDENRLLRESSRLATEAFQKKVQELEFQFNARYLAAIESFKKEAQAIKFELTRNHLLALELSQRKILELSTTINQLIERQERAKKYIAWLTRQHFGQSSEKMALKSVSQEQPIDNVVSISEPPVKRKRGQKSGKGNGHGRSDRSQLETEEEFIEIENCYCSVCCKPFRILNETEDSEVVEINVRAYRRIYRRRKAVSQCMCKGRQIITAPVAPKLYPKTQIGNSLWIYLIVWKYLRGVPINRILQDLSLRGLHLSIGTVIGGFVFISVLLDVLYRAIIAHCQADDLWTDDETTWRVFEEDDGTRNKRKWWYWLFGGTDAIVYKLDARRSKDIPKDFYTASSGVLMSDRLASYKSLSDSIKNAFCWVHVKRDFHKIYQGMPALKDWAEDWLTQIGLVFSLNNERVDLWKAGQDWQEAQKALEQHMQQIKERCENQLQEIDLHKQQKKVLNSLKNHWDGLVLFLTDPRIPASNNRAERLLRPLVISRKNSYGSGKEWSGVFAAKVFTIMQTWQINGLNPEALLLDYFDQCSKLPKIRGKPPPTPDLKEFLPWLMPMERKQKFTLPKNIKRPA
jgi:transposase